MAESDLTTYLKDIAVSLKSIATSGDVRRNNELFSLTNTIGSSTISELAVFLENNRVFKESLLQEVSQGVIKSVFEVLKDALVEALTVEVIENNTAVRKGIAQLINEQNTILSDIISGQSTTNTTLQAVRTATENTAARLLDSQAVPIANDVEAIKTELAYQGTAVREIKQHLSPAYESIDNISQKLKDIRTNTGSTATNTQLTNVNVVSADRKLADIYTKVSSIDTKIQ